MSRACCISLAVLASLVLSSRGQCPDASEIPPGCVCDDESDLYIKCESLGLQAIPDDLPSQITHLKLSGNNLTTVEDINYGELRRLYLPNNNIKVIQPGAFRRLLHLELLSLNNNQLVSLDASMFLGLHKLQMLYLEKNSIDSIGPATFNGSELKNISQIRLSYNQLSKVGDEHFHSLSTLTELILMVNKLVEFGPFSEGTFPKLARLHLSNNTIEFHSKQFSELSSLTNLYATHNQLSFLPKATFDGVEDTLELVDLSYNKLTPTLGNVFKDMEKLNELQLAYNRLSWLEEDSLNFKALQKLYIHDNPWDCKCDNEWFLHRPQVREYNPDRVTCNTPEEYHNVSIYKVSFHVLHCGGSGGSHKTALGFALGLFVGILVSLIAFFIYRRYWLQRGGGGLLDVSSRYKRVRERGGEPVF